MAEEEVLEVDGNALLGVIKQQRERGKSFYEIEQIFNIPAARAEAIYSEHMRERRTKIDNDEYRLLQLDRLEGLIDVLQSQAVLGNSKSADVLLKALEQINELMGLNLQVQRTEVTVVSETQSTVIFDIAWSMCSAILKRVIEPMLIEMGEEKRLAMLEDTYPEVVSEFYSEALVLVVEPEVETSGN